MLDNEFDSILAAVIHENDTQSSISKLFNRLLIFFGWKKDEIGEAMDYVTKAFELLDQKEQPLILLNKIRSSRDQLVQNNSTENLRTFLTNFVDFVNSVMVPLLHTMSSLVPPIAKILVRVIIKLCSNNHNCQPLDFKNTLLSINGSTNDDGSKSENTGDNHNHEPFDSKNTLLPINDSTNDDGSKSENTGNDHNIHHNQLKIITSTISHKALIIGEEGDGVDGIVQKDQNFVAGYCTLFTTSSAETFDNVCFDKSGYGLVIIVWPNTYRQGQFVDLVIIVQQMIDRDMPTILVHPQAGIFDYHSDGFVYQYKIYVSHVWSIKHTKTVAIKANILRHIRVTDKTNKNLFVGAGLNKYSRLPDNTIRSYGAEYSKSGDVIVYDVKNLFMECCGITFVHTATHDDVNQFLLRTLLLLTNSQIIVSVNSTFREFGEWAAGMSDQILVQYQ